MEDEDVDVLLQVHDELMIDPSLRNNLDEIMQGARVAHDDVGSD